MKKILYVHGFNSSGSTGRFMKEYFGNLGYEVFAPEIPQDCDEAIRLVEKTVRDNKIDLVIGTSLGGYVTLNIKESVLRVAINPTLDPFNTLPKLGCKKEVYESYKDKSVKDNIDSEIKKVTYGMFGGNDKVVNYRNEFEKIYSKNHTYFVPTMEHQIKPSEIEVNLTPLVTSLIG